MMGAGAATVARTCEFCRRGFHVRAGEDRYRAKHGVPPVRFCSLKCSGASRRDGLTLAEKRAKKRLYDMRYRAQHRHLLKTKHRAYYLANFDPAKARAWRSTPRRRAYHSAYIRSAKYRAWKSQYDLNHRASDYGPFAEAYKALLKLQKLIIARAPNKYERLKARGYYESRGVQNRKRNEQVNRW